MVQVKSAFAGQSNGFQQDNGQSQASFNQEPSNQAAKGLFQIPPALLQ